MIIKVIELCEVEPYEDGKVEGLRTIIYESSKETLLEAHIDFEENFDSDNIIKSEDNFDGECLNSKVIGVSIAIEYN